MKRIWWPILLVMLSKRNHVHHAEKSRAALSHGVRLWRAYRTRQDPKTRPLRAKGRNRPSCRDMRSRKTE